MGRRRRGSYSRGAVCRGLARTDETPLGEITVRVSHRLEPRADGLVDVTHAVRIDGAAQAAQQIGAMITADFPATMASLIALAKDRSDSN